MTREEKIEHLAKAVMTLSELGYNKTAYVLNEIRLEMKSQLELPDGLDEEIKRYGKEEMPVVLESDLNDIARHFYKLGQQNCPKISDNSLEEEINKKLGHDDWLEVVFDRKTLIDFAGHFYTLGLNTRKDE